MTSEYVPGHEDIFLLVEARPDKLVSLAVYHAHTRERLYGVVLPPEVARQCAQKLTLASWKAEDQTGE